MARTRRALHFAVPSLVASCVAGVVVGGVESMIHPGGGVRALAGVGFLCLVAVPAGLALGVAVRGMWRAWQIDRAIEAGRSETGGVPGIAGWLLFTAIAAWSVFAYAFNVVWVLSWASGNKKVTALASALAMAAIVVVVFAVSRPLVRGFTWVIDRVDRWLHARVGRSIVAPWALVAIVAIGTAITVVVSWYVTVEPRIGDLDTRPMLLAVAHVSVLVVVTLAWPALRRRAPVAHVAGVGWVGAACALMVTAVVVRYQQPYTMLEVWGETPLAGGAIDVVWDVQGMRDELDLDGFTPVARPGARHPDVILVTIDTVRADRTPLHGGPAKMPALFGLAKQGANLRWAFAPGNVTRRSLPSMIMGVSPRRVRGRVAGWALRLDPRHVTVTERFRSAGYDTAGFFCCESQFGRRHELGLIRGFEHVAIHYDGTELTGAAVSWLAERRQKSPTRPLFMWIHYIEPHRWDETHTAKEHGGNMKRRYDMALADIDTMLGPLIAEAWSIERRDDTIVAVTSDHGEGLGDRGHKFHSTELYNEQIRVPLVIVGPDIAPRVVRENVGLTSLAPTLLDLAGFVPPGMPQMDGPSLAPLLTGARDEDVDASTAFADMIEDRSNKKNWRAAIEGRFKLIDRGNSAPELYDLRADPGEKKNLARDQPEVVRRMKMLLDQQRAVEAQSPFP